VSARRSRAEAGPARGSRRAPAGPTARPPAAAASRARRKHLGLSASRARNRTCSWHFRNRSLGRFSAQPRDDQVADGFHPELIVHDVLLPSRRCINAAATSHVRPQRPPASRRRVLRRRHPTARRVPSPAPRAKVTGFPCSTSCSQASWPAENRRRAPAGAPAGIRLRRHRPGHRGGGGCAIPRSSLVTGKRAFESWKGHDRRAVAGTSIGDRDRWRHVHPTRTTARHCTGSASWSASSPRPT